MQPPLEMVLEKNTEDKVNKMEVILVVAIIGGAILGAYKLTPKEWSGFPILPVDISYIRGLLLYTKRGLGLNETLDQQYNNSILLKFDNLRLNLILASLE